MNTDLLITDSSSNPNQLFEFSGPDPAVMQFNCKITPRPPARKKVTKPAAE